MLLVVQIDEFPVAELRPHHVLIIPITFQHHREDGPGRCIVAHRSELHFGNRWRKHMAEVLLQFRGDLLPPTQFQ